MIDNYNDNKGQFEEELCLGWKNALAHWQPKTK